MELELTRVDYAIVGLTTSKCMKLLPSPDPKMVQKVVIGDQDGVLQIFSLKKGEVQTLLKTAQGSRITSLDLGGTSESSKDKIFISCDGEVKGFTKKGKQFLGFDTNLTESITAMCVEGSQLFVTGQHSFYHYQDLKDANSFFCGDIINDLIVVPSRKVNIFTPILACDDRIIRILEDSHVLYSVPISSSPTVLHAYNTSDENENQIMYGTSDGGVGLLLIGRELKNSWLLEPNSEKGQITTIDTYDLTGDGEKELIVGRDDGIIEVYKLNQDDEPVKLIYSYNCNETVTCLVCGIVGNNGFDEILVSTYSGWIFGLTTEVTSKNIAISVDSNSIKLSQEAKQKILRLRFSKNQDKQNHIYTDALEHNSMMKELARSLAVYAQSFKFSAFHTVHLGRELPFAFPFKSLAEIEELEEKTLKERERYQNAIENDENALSTIPFIPINDKFYLHREDASYSLCIEVQTSIDNVLIQSDVPVDLLDVEKNSAIVSFSDCNPASGNFLLATYRCQLNTTRLDLKIRTIEGQYGMLHTYVTPNIQPKCCQLRSYRIKPLSLHTRIHTFDSKRPSNVLNFKGGFSLAEIHSWVEFCLPEVPEKPPPGDSAELVFVSTFLDTMLLCTYSKGEAQFKSDNVSTISILKDVISKEATKNITKKRNLDITWQLNEDSIKHTLDLLRPKLEHQLDLLRKIKILESMTELDLSASSSDVTLLTDEYLDIIKNEKAIVEEYKRQPAYLDRLYGMITDLFIDKHKFLGTNVKGKIASLLEILERDQYSYEQLLAFFGHQI